MLRRVAQEHYSAAYGSEQAGQHGMAHQAADVAEDAIFGYLNVCSSHLSDAVAAEAIHDRP